MRGIDLNYIPCECYRFQEALDSALKDFSIPYFAGITTLLVNGQRLLLTEALSVAERELMGEYAHLWPLTKVGSVVGLLH